jgi:hypothetical protein
MRIWTIGAILLGFCGTLQANPLDVRQVSGDAKWLVHLDVDAMRDSTLVVKAYLADTQPWKQLQSWLDTACQEIGVDVKTDLHGITVFGKNLGKLQGVAIINAEMQPDVILARAKTEPGYKSTKYGDGQIYSWTDGRETIVGTFYEPTVLVIARTQKEVQHAIDVLSGKEAGLAEEQCPVVGTVPAGTMLVAWAKGLADLPLPFQSAAVLKSQAIGLLVSEKQGEVSATLRLVIPTADTAGKVLAVLEGLRSAAELQYEGNAGMTSILSRLKLSAAGLTVNAELRAPADDLWNQVQRLFATVPGQHP